MFDDILQTLYNLLSPLLSVLSGGINALWKKADADYNSIINYISNSISSISSNITSLQSGIINSLSPRLTELNQLINNTSSIIGDNLNFGLSGLSTLYAKGVEVIQSDLFKFAVGIGNNLSLTQDIIVSGIEIIGKGISAGLEKIEISLEDLAKGAMNVILTLPNLLEDFKESVFKKLEEVLTVDEEDLNQVGEMMKNFKERYKKIL